MDTTEDAEDELAEEWLHSGSDEIRRDLEDVCRQLQCGGDKKLAAIFQQKQRFRSQGSARAKAKAKARAATTTGSDTGIPSPATPRATPWDEKRWSERLHGVPSEEHDIAFPPLQAKGTSSGAPGAHPQAATTVSATGTPSAAGAQTDGPTGSVPPAQGTVSPTGPPSAGPPGAGTPATPRASGHLGQENGRGDGSAA